MIILMGYNFNSVHVYHYVTAESNISFISLLLISCGMLNINQQTKLRVCFQRRPQQVSLHPLHCK